MEKAPLLWVRFLKRHDAKIIDVLFLDKDYDIKDEDIKGYPLHGNKYNWLHCKKNIIYYDKELEDFDLSDSGDNEYF